MKVKMKSRRSWTGGEQCSSSGHISTSRVRPPPPLELQNTWRVRDSTNGASRLVLGLGRRDTWRLEQGQNAVVGS